jgi:uncharacterized protein YcbK (DUF882 family)
LIRLSVLRRLASPAVCIRSALCALAVIGGTRGTQDAIANGDTRTINILHMHTKEETSVTFKRNGYYDASALAKLNYALRDWRNDDQVKFDPRLFDVAWEVHRSVGSGEPLHVVSAYRSPGTNAMLRRRSRGVAKHSQHMLGKAMDFYLPDVSPARVREIGMRLQRGGVGYYPSAYTPFVHLDVGSVRSWPRMTRDQLARLFPDGRTVHLPADGEPLDGYETAKAEIIARGGSVAGYAAADLDEGAIIAGGSRSSFWSFLFGGGDEEQQDARPTRGRRGSVVASRRASPAPDTLAYAPAGSSDNDPLGRFGSGAVAAAPQAIPLRERIAERSRNRRGAPAAQQEEETRVASLSPTAPPTAAALQQAAPEAKTPSLVAAPMPIARPRNLVLPEAAPDATQTASVSSPATDATPAGRLIAAPTPPLRPATMGSLAIEAIATAPASATQAAEAGQQPLPTGRLVAILHPAPPLRPAGMAASEPAKAPQRAASPEKPAEKPAQMAVDKAVDKDRAGLDLLFAGASRTTSATPARVVTAKARQLAPDSDSFTPGNSPAAAFGFSRGKATDMATDKFSGQAVKPLPSNFMQQ